MSRFHKIAALIPLALLATQIAGCSTSGARPAYHISASAPQYWGAYGYRRAGYYGGYGYGRIGRPYYGRGYGGYRRY